MRSLDELTMYMYGLLDPAAEEEMKAHLGECAECHRTCRRIAGEHKLFKGALAREYPDLPAWTNAGASRHRRKS
jgi:anti-sigma factor RsiW